MIYTCSTRKNINIQFKPLCDDRDNERTRQNCNENIIGT